MSNIALKFARILNECPPSEGDALSICATGADCIDALSPDDFIVFV